MNIDEQNHEYAKQLIVQFIATEATAEPKKLMIDSIAELLLHVTAWYEIFRANSSRETRLGVLFGRALMETAKQEKIDLEPPFWAQGDEATMTDEELTALQQQHQNHSEILYASTVRTPSSWRRIQIWRIRGKKIRASVEWVCADWSRVAVPYNSTGKVDVWNTEREQWSNVVERSSYELAVSIFHVTRPPETLSDDQESAFTDDVAKMLELATRILFD